MDYRILVINPGSTSTKIAVFHGQTPLMQKTIRHSGEELAPFGAIMDQAPFRRRCVEEALTGLPSTVAAALPHAVLLEDMVIVENAFDLYLATTLILVAFSGTVN